MRYLHFIRVYLGLSGRSAARVAAPLYFGILVVVAVVFGPTGMDAADLVFTMRTAPRLMVVLSFGWIVLTFPVARLAFVPTSSLYLRWLPIPRAILYISAGLCGVAVESPWIVLFARGEGPISGFAAGLSAISFHAACLVRPFRFRHVLLLGLWAISVFAPSLPISFVAAILGAALAVMHAVDRAGEVDATSALAPRVSAPVVAIVRTHLTYLWRQEPAVIGRMLVMSSLAGLCMPFAARGFDLESPRDFGKLAMGLSVVALSPAMSGASAAIMRSERHLSWLSDVLRSPGQTRVIAAAAATATVGLVAGVCLGLIGLLNLGLSEWSITLRIMFIPVGWACAIGILATNWAREVDALPKRGDRGMVAVLVAMFVGILMTSKWGEGALGIGLSLAIAGLVVAPRRWEILRRRRGIS